MDFQASSDAGAVDTYVPNGEWHLIGMLGWGTTTSLPACLSIYEHFINYEFKSTLEYQLTVIRNNVNRMI